MKQERLNNLMILHVHKGKTDSIDLSSCCNDFVTGNEHQLQVFGSFKESTQNLKYNLGRTIKFFLPPGLYY